MSKRQQINLTIALIFLSLVASGILLFLVPYNSLFSGVHAWAGFCFIAISLFHIKINFQSLLRYIKNKAGFVIILATGILIFIIILSVYYRIKPFSSVLDFGNNMRKTAIIQESHSQTILIELETQRKNLSIEVRVGEEYRARSIPFYFGTTTTSPPQFVFWLENEKGEYLETIFVTEKTGFPILYPNDKFKSGVVVRNEALPYWQHKREEKLLVQDQTKDVDGVTGATPHANFKINSYTPLKKFKILSEVNHSFDFNHFYTKGKYPNDPVYTGDGYPGQPSIIYAADIDLSSGDKTFIMRPIGRGHHSGANGLLYSDMTGIDSALDIFQRVLVDIEAN